MGRPTVSVTRLREVPEKTDGFPGGRDHRRGTPGGVDMIPLEAQEDTSRMHARPWGTASAQVFS